MPTARARYQVTETDEVARAIDAASQLWPGEPRSRLIVRAIVAGGDALKNASADDERAAARERVRGKYSGTFEPSYLEALREDWPE